MNGSYNINLIITFWYPKITQFFTHILNCLKRRANFLLSELIEIVMLFYLCWPVLGYFRIETEDKFQQLNLGKTLAMETTLPVVLAAHLWLYDNKLSNIGSLMG